MDQLVGSHLLMRVVLPHAILRLRQFLFDHATVHLTSWLSHLLLGAVVLTHAFPLQMLAASVKAVNSIRILDSRDWFQSELYPRLGPPYNVQYTNS